MLNDFDKLVVYLDKDTLKYMFMCFNKNRDYPVMKKLYSMLHDGYKNNFIVTPITFNHIMPYIDENTIDNEYLAMMGNIGQIQFHRRFTVRTLQLIRIINYFFEKKYNKPQWRDVFSSNPEDKYIAGFNQYRSISIQNVLKSYEREKNASRIYYFIENYKQGHSFDDIAGEYFQYFWDEFPDLITPFLPLNGSADYNMKIFLDYDEINEIPEYHLASNLLSHLFETYGIDEIESGSKDDLLLAAETAAAYMPYCHFYVTSIEIAEIINMNGMNESYDVKVYDNNESSLYKLIEDLGFYIETLMAERKLKANKSIFKKGKY
ncbi:hypothetical protein ACFL2X_02375 [Candidatus Latescibacterota bacterium]